MCSKAASIARRRAAWRADPGWLPGPDSAGRRYGLGSSHSHERDALAGIGANDRGLPLPRLGLRFRGRDGSQVCSFGSMKQLRPLWHKSCVKAHQKQFNRNKQNESCVNQH